MSQYNEIPENFREISANEFARKMLHYSSVKNEGRQLHGLHEYVTNAHLWFYHDGTGIAITYENIKTDTYPFYENVAKFYAFGCDHQYKRIPWDRETMGPQFNCNNAYQCIKCGYIQILDSSD